MESIEDGIIGVNTVLNVLGRHSKLRELAVPSKVASCIEHELYAYLGGRTLNHK